MGIEEIVKEQLATMNMDEIEELFYIATNEGSVFSETTPGEVIKSIIMGKPIFDMNDILSSITGMLFQEITGSIILGVQLVIICIIIGLLSNLSTSFGEDTVSNLGIIVCSCSVIALCLKSFMDIYSICSEAIDTMTVVMQALLPVIVPLLITMGGFASGGVLNPFIVTAITLFNTVLQNLSCRLCTYPAYLFC